MKKPVLGRLRLILVRRSGALGVIPSRAPWHVDWWRQRGNHFPDLDDYSRPNDKGPELPHRELEG